MTKTQRWNRTMLNWFKTACMYPFVRNGKEYHLYNMRAILHPEHLCELEISIAQGSGEPLASKDVVPLFNYLAHNFERKINLANPHDLVIQNTHMTVLPPRALTNTFCIHCILGNEESFCDFSIKLVREIFRRLEITYQPEEAISDFWLTQDTYMRVENEWISLESWIKLKNKLKTFKILGKPKQFGQKDE
jgi:hypothetical protein